MDALPLLRSKGEAIQYEYDGHNRLVKINYPRTADVTYLYGGSDKASVSGAGRLLQRVDESGTTDFTYGKLGETVAMTREIERLTPLADPVSASFSYVSDYLGRLESITYPDGEVIQYGYDSGGQIETVTGTHWGRTTEYVKDIAYDAFGQRTYIEYGNGVRTSYTYDENRRWLDAIDTSSSWGATYQAMHYSFDLVGNVLGYTNTAGTYETSQSYGYDSLYQLTSASGTTTNKEYGMTDYVSNYAQTYAFDEIGNMTKKTSSHTVNPSKSIGDELNYNLGYTYYAGKSHQAEIIGNIYYKYDASGNVTETRKGGHSAGAMPSGEVYRNGDVSYTDKGFALLRNGNGDTGETVWSRYYVWNEENRLKKSVEGDLTVDYRYGADGERAVKYSKRSETLYFDSMWQAMTDYPSLRQSKHVYVGKVRVASRLNIAGQVDVGYEEKNTYFYHPDHVGSAQLVTDPDGEEYERIEYTPYGELWVEKTSESFDKIPFRFTGKELDDETELYYYGARYLDPRTSTWLSADPALGDYIPVAPVDEEARKKNGNLPGMGGVYNLVNLHLYHYAGNNPVKYTDPDGREADVVVSEVIKSATIDIGGKTPRDVLFRGLLKADSNKVQTDISITTRVYKDKDGSIESISVETSYSAVEGYSDVRTSVFNDEGKVDFSSTKYNISEGIRESWDCNENEHVYADHLIEQKGYIFTTVVNESRMRCITGDDSKYDGPAGTQNKGINILDILRKLSR